MKYPEEILVPQNYDNLSIEDKLKYRENQVHIALERNIVYNNKIEELEQQLVEKDKEVEKLKTRISELEDKDWYEKCIRQLEEQNNNLIKERDELRFEKVPDKGQLEIRKQVCDEVYTFIMNHWEEKMSKYGEYLNTNGRCDKLREDLDRIAKGGL